MSRPRAAIVATGSELVRGERHDRNGPFLAAEAVRLGLEPASIEIVGDAVADLERAFRDAFAADLCLVSGGLGPTHDDRTVELVARVAGRPLILDEGLEEEIGAISRRFADRLGRVRALSLSILLYSAATAGLATSAALWQLVAWRVAVGLGMGGEWSCGSVLVAETWPAEHRGKAMGLMQSGWAIGAMIAAGASALIIGRFGWRVLFLIGALPAIAAYFIRRNVEEPKVWTERTREASRVAARWVPLLNYS